MKVKGNLMTTIAWSDNHIAADTLISQDGYVRGFTQKIIERDGIVFGFAGGLSFMEGWIEWWLNGHDPKEKPTTPDRYEGVLLVFSSEGSWAVETHAGDPTPLENEVCAEGSGAVAALGALKMGATPEQAVKVAIEVDLYSGGEITVLERPQQSKLQVA